MRFLARFQAFCRRIFRASAERARSLSTGDNVAAEQLVVANLEHPSSAPEPAATPCARFLNSDRKYNRAQGRATYRAFQPAFDNAENAVVLSMYRTDGMGVDVIWQLGRTVLGADGGHLHGRAELLKREIEALPEKVVPAKKFRARFDDDPPRHVTVAPWDDDKENRKLHAMELASVSRLYLL